MKSQKFLAGFAAMLMSVVGATAAHAQAASSTAGGTEATTAPSAQSATMAPAAGSDTADSSTTVNTKADANATPAMGSAKISHMTKEFIETASEANMFEIDSSKIALTKSTNQKIKDFAQKMVDDHTKAGDDMKTAIASSPDEQALVATKESSKHQRVIDSLNKDDATAFDKDYVNAQVDAHKDAVKLFGKYSAKGDDASLKTFATNTLPVLQGHKDMIDSIKASMK